MKKILVLLTAFTILFCFTSCGGDNQKADETAYPFIEAMLERNDENMKQYLHPDYVETALPNDDFYKSLENAHFFSVGNTLDALEAAGKKNVEDTSFEGNLMQCSYLIRSNELFYDVTLMMLDNESGYGIVAVSVELNTEALYYAISNGNV